MTDVVTVTQVISEILVEFSVYTWVGIYCGRYTGVYYLVTATQRRGFDSDGLLPLEA